MVRPSSRLFVPRVARRVMSVSRGDRAQIVTFPQESHARRVVELLARGDALMVDGTVLTAMDAVYDYGGVTDEDEDEDTDEDTNEDTDEDEDTDEEGIEIDVLETSVRSLQMVLPDIGVYVCTLSPTADVVIVREKLLGCGHGVSWSVQDMREVAERSFRL